MPLLEQKKFTFQMGTVYIRRSCRPGHCVVCLQTFVHTEVSLLMTTQGNAHGLVWPWSSMVPKDGGNSKLHCLCYCTHCYWEAPCFAYY